MNRVTIALLFAILALACQRGAPGPDAVVPDPDTSAMQRRVAERIGEARRQVLEQPGSAQSWGTLGAICDVHELYDCAETGYREARRLASDNPRWPYLLAMVREQRGGDHDEIITLFRSVSTLDASYPPLYYRMGGVFLGQGKLDEALTHYRRALELSPDMASAHLGLGQALLELDQAEEALRHLQRGIEIAGNNSRLHAAMAQAYGRLGQEDLAREASDRSKQAGQTLVLRDDHRAWVDSLGVSSRYSYDRGIELMQQGLYAEALEHFKIVEETRPDFASLSYRIGICLAKTGQVDPAMEYLRKTLELNEQMPTAHESLGTLLAYQGRVDEAIVHFRRWKELDPASATAVTRLAQALAQRGAFADARAELEELERRGPLDDNARTLLEMLQSRGQ